MGKARPVEELVELSPFSVFCTLYLGITQTQGYAEMDLGRVARQFNLRPDELGDYLQAHLIAGEHLRKADFDGEAARFDIKVAPEGISRLELGRTLFEEFRHDRDR